MLTLTLLAALIAVGGITWGMVMGDLVAEWLETEADETEEAE